MGRERPDERSGERLNVRRGVAEQAQESGVIERYDEPFDEGWRSENAEAWSSDQGSGWDLSPSGRFLIPTKGLESSPEAAPAIEWPAESAVETELLPEGFDPVPDSQIASGLRPPRRVWEEISQTLRDEGLMFSASDSLPPSPN